MFVLTALSAKIRQFYGGRSAHRIAHHICLTPRFDSFALHKWI